MRMVAENERNMADPKFETKLNELLNNVSFIESDFLTYITMLIDLTKLMEREIGFHTYAAIVKKWISGFENIFSENKVPEIAQKFWQTYRSQFCPVITKIYLSLLRNFHQFEPSYTQEFYSHWKTIASRMDATKRAKSFEYSVEKFKIVIQHLRTAAHRCEQFSILSVLKLYVENASISDLHKLRENDNFQIVHKIEQLMKNPTILNQHAFLYDIDPLGQCIESLKPKRIICKKLEMQYDNSEHEMWLDFNKTDKSVIFIAVSLADNGSQTLAVGGRISLRENAYDDHILEIKGVWNVMVNKNVLVRKKTIVTVYLLDDVQRSISKSVKNGFYCDHPAGHGGSVSQDLRTDYTEYTIEGSAMPPKQLRCAEDLVPSVSPPRFITQPFAQLERSDNRFSLTVRQNMENVNVSVRLCSGKEDTGDNATNADQRDATASNRARQSVNSNASSDAMIAVDGRRSTDANLTYVKRQSVNPIAAKQSEKDRMHRENDSYDEILMDVEQASVDPWTQNESEAIRDDVLSDISIHGKRMVADDVHELFVVSDDDGMETCEPEQETDDCYSTNAEKQSNVRFGNKQIQVIGDILIVPPNIRNERVELPCNVPLDYLLSKGVIKFLHFSQVEEKLTATHIETFNSQPTTKRERFSVKSSSNQRRVDQPLRSNEPIQSPPRISVVDSPTKAYFENQNEIADESNGSTKNIRKRSSTSVKPNSSQKRCKRLDHAIELSPERSQKTQKLSSLPIATTSQSQCDSFAPLATSTQKLPLQSQLQNTSNSQNATEMSTHNSSQSERSYLRSMPEVFSQPTTATQATSKLPTWNNSQNRRDFLSDANETSHAENFRTESKFRNASFIPPVEEMETARTMPSSSQKSAALPENTTMFGTETESLPEAMNSSQQKTKMSQALPAIRPVSTSPRKTSSSQQRTKVSDSTPVVTQATQRNSAQNHSQRTANVNQTSKKESVTQNTSQGQFEPRATGVNKKAKFTARKSQIPTRKQVPTSVTQTSKTALNSAPPRYSSLNRNKRAARVDKENFFRTSFNGAGNATENKLNDEATDNIQIDDSGKVYDRKGCVFADNAELQRVAQFYIANDGLEFMKTEYFKDLPAKNREKYERKLRTIHTMINHGLDELHCHAEKEAGGDPYEVNKNEYLVQTAKRSPEVHVAEEVSVTISREHTMANNSKKVTFARRVSKLFYVFDEKAMKSMNNSNKEPNTVPVKTTQSLVNLTSKMNGNGQKKKTSILKSSRDEERPTSVPESVDCYDHSSLMDSDRPLVAKNFDRAETETTTKKRPIYATAKVKAKQEQEHNDSTAKIRSTSRAPIYASDKMLAANRVKFNSSTMTENLNQPLRYSESPSPSENSVVNSPMEESSENINENRIDVCAKRRCERVQKLQEICSTITCNMNDLICSLEEMAKDPLHTCPVKCDRHGTILMQFIDRLQPNHSKQTPTVTGCLQLFNLVLTSYESVCSEASERFQSFQKK